MEGGLLSPVDPREQSALANSCKTKKRKAEPSPAEAPVEAPVEPDEQHEEQESRVARVAAQFPEEYTSIIRALPEATCKPVF
jgi:hypothetical protein